MSELVSRFDNLHGSRRERHNVLPFGLHALRWNRPKLRVESEFIPRCAPYFAGSGSGQDEELKGQSDHLGDWSGFETNDKDGQLSIGKGGEMFHRFCVPGESNSSDPAWIFTAPVSRSGCMVEHSTKPLHYAAGGFRFGSPDGQKDLKDVASSNTVHWQVPDHWVGVTFQCGEPLVSVLGVTPSRHVRGMHGLGHRLERGHSFPLCSPRGHGVYSGLCFPSDLVG